MSLHNFPGNLATLSHVTSHPNKSCPHLLSLDPMQATFQGSCGSCDSMARHSSRTAIGFVGGKSFDVCIGSVATSLNFGCSGHSMYAPVMP
mmetsp:Transcript_22010/g.50215  ORF Transcript_22010/g.50215 Transcript_22010/m.50215 type:complete len:91 (+) Transcript_22010:28-300(+)